MKKNKKILFFFAVGILLLSIVGIVLELFGISFCLFGAPLHAWLVIPFCAAAICITVLLFLWLRVRKRTGEDRLQCTLLQTVSVVICSLLVVASMGAAAFTGTSYTKSSLAADKAHKAFVEAESESQEPTVDVYKRYSPFLMSYRNSAVLYGFHGELDEIVYVWYDTYCEVQYPGFTDDAQTQADISVLSRKIYYVAP